MSRERLIEESHLQRKALVYVRQSTPGQVRRIVRRDVALDLGRPSTRTWGCRARGSGEDSCWVARGENRATKSLVPVAAGCLQYQLRDVALELGWGSGRIETIDEDLGVSGSGEVQRGGFERLTLTVARGEAGAVFGLEASRLSRNEVDWFQLLRWLRLDRHAAGGEGPGVRPRQRGRCVDAGPAGHDLGGRGIQHALAHGAGAVEQGATRAAVRERADRLPAGGGRPAQGSGPPGAARDRAGVRAVPASGHGAAGGAGAAGGRHAAAEPEAQPAALGVERGELRAGVQGADEPADGGRVRSQQLGPAAHGDALGRA